MIFANGPNLAVHELWSEQERQVLRILFALETHFEINALVPEVFCDFLHAGQGLLTLLNSGQLLQALSTLPVAALLACGKLHVH